jgi:penicillin-binding protein 1A
MTRKVVELWFALQLERQFTKREILEFYINEIPFGGGTNGVEAASQFYFSHSAKDLTLAESVLLANVIARPTKYSPILNPQVAKERQKEILKQMVSLGYATEADADRSYREYWSSYDYTRARSSADLRQDKAPWFSWYVKDKLDELHFSSDDILKGGLKIYTTLNLEYQGIADRVMDAAIKDIREKLKNVDSTRMQYGDNIFIPIVDLLALSYNITDLRTAGNKERAKADAYYQKLINPIVDIFASSFNMDELKEAAIASYRKQVKQTKTSDVEGALAAIDSKTGHILAMVGGSYFDSRTNWFNRAAYARVQPGSTFKPLYYSVAVNKKLITPGSTLVDAPVVFWNDDGTPYTPMNYKGRWYGPVLTRFALAKSLNIPALKILEKVGFDDAISTSARMLGITDPSEIERNFPRKFPLGLGILWVSPIQMAKAFATFPNDGKEVTPIAIRYIEDRQGKIIMEPEKELRAEQKRQGNDIRIITPQAAYLMTDMLQSSVDYGTLVGVKWRFKDRPLAGKSGTTENWADTWAVGFTPQITAAVWFGFDTPGKSFGTELYGGTAAGPAWGEFMQLVHNNLPIKDFTRPASGLVNVDICNVSGLLPDPDGGCSGRIMSEVFMSGTQPMSYCQIHSAGGSNNADILENLRNDMYTDDINIDEILKQRELDKLNQKSEKNGSQGETGNTTTDDEDTSINTSQYNPLLDD